MPQVLSQLKLDEVSLVDKPANSTTGKDGKKTPRAVIALFKRDVEKDITINGGESKGEKDIEKEGAKGVQFVIGFKGSGEGSEVQSIIFDKDSWDENSARKWLSDHDMKAGKIDTTANSLRFRQKDPEGFDRFRVIKPGGGKQKQIGLGTRDAFTGKKEKHDYGPDDKEIWEKDKCKSGNKCSKGDQAMTLEELEARVSKQDEDIATLTKRNAELDAENAMVIKMSKSERKAYAGMSEEKRKAFMAADTKKRGEMLTEAKAQRKEKKLEDSMDAACKAEYDAAGPVQKAAMLEEQERLLKRMEIGDEPVTKAGKKRLSADTEDDDDYEDGMGEDEDEEAEKKKSMKKSDTVMLRQQLAAAEDRIAKSEHELTAIRKRERDVYFEARAERELPHTPGSPAEKGAMIQKLADTFGEDSQSFKKLLNDLKNADKILGDQFSEIGKAARGDMPALAVFDAKVEEISKRDKIDKPHAVAKAMEEAPELYLDYERSQRQIVARA